MANVITVRRYAGLARQLANRIKNPADIQALETAAEEMASFVPAGAILVPAPSSTGKNSAMLVLSQMIAEMTDDAIVIDAVRRTRPMPSKVLLRRAGKPLPSFEEQVASMALVEPIHDGSIWIVDNVVTSGETIRAMEKVLGREVNAIVYADAARGGAREPRLGGLEAVTRAGGRVCVSGSRDYAHLDNVNRVLESFPQGIVIVHGGAPGVDRRTDEVARLLGMEVDVWKAEWERYGRRAGPLRNRQMVASCDFLLAFWNGVSRGTASAIQAAVDEDIPFEIVEDV